MSALRSAVVGARSQALALRPGYQASGAVRCYSISQAYHRPLAPTASLRLLPVQPPVFGSQRRNFSLDSLDSLNPVPFLGDLLVSTPTPSYALSIVVLTIAIRSTVTVPFTIWQRKRMRRMRELINPEMKAANELLAVKVAKESRAKGLDYEQYRKELKIQLADYQSALHRKYGTHPAITMAAPLLVHVPVLVLTSLAIRHAIAVPDSALAAQSALWLNALGDPDQTMILPIIGGMLGFSNAELVARKRKAREAEDIAETKPEMTTAVESEVAQARAGSQPPSRRPATPAPARAAPIQGATELSSHLRRKLSTSAVLRAIQPPRRRSKALPSAKPVSQMPLTLEVSGKDRNQADAMAIAGTMFGYVLRCFSVLFVVLAAWMPSGLVLYWTTSMCFSLAQNVILGRLDARENAMHARNRALERAQRVAAMKGAGKA